MFTSRCPRNRNEIAACVSFFRHSPHWSDTDLCEADMVDAWEELLKSGHAVIEIIENKRLLGDLQNKRKAIENPHYLHGFVYVAFACYVKLDMVRKVLDRNNDEADPLIYFLECYKKYRNGESSENPISEIDKDGKLLDQRVSVVASGIFHSHLSPHFSLSTFKFLKLTESFAVRIYASVMQYAIGFKHEAVLHSAVGRHFVAPLENAGLKLVREYSGNHLRPNRAKKFVFAATLDRQTSIKLGLDRAIQTTAPGVFTQYTYMFIDDTVKRVAGLTKLQQHVCFLLLTGYSYPQIARAFESEEYDHLTGEIARLTAKQTVSSLSSLEEKLLAKYKQSYKNMINKVKNAKRQAAENLAAANLIEPPFDEELLLAALKQSNAVAHEIREYLFPVYPWPEDLDSRRA